MSILLSTLKSRFRVLITVVAKLIAPSLVELISIYLDEKKIDSDIYFELHFTWCSRDFWESGGDF